MNSALVRLLRRHPRMYAAARSAYRRLRGISRPPVVHDLGVRNTLAVDADVQTRDVRVTLRGDDNVVTFGGKGTIEGCRITIEGNGNRIEITSADVHDMTVIIGGDANRVLVAADCMLLSPSVVCEDSGNLVSIGRGTQMHGVTELAALEGTSISIGTDCLFSGAIHFRTGDSHALLDLDGRRINPSADIVIGDHVWVGLRVTVLKGARVARDSVVGACAVVTGRFDTPNVAIAGNPARVVREGIDWSVSRTGYSAD